MYLTYYESCQIIFVIPSPTPADASYGLRITADDIPTDVSYVLRIMSNNTCHPHSHSLSPSTHVSYHT